MHFPKLLNTLIYDVLPDWKDKFLCYKDLKKQLRKINKRMKSTAGDESDPVAVEKEVANCIKLCQQKFNNFILDKQEWYTIIIEGLEGKLVAAKNLKLEVIEIGRDLVDLHGEMVLLLNYSALNYIGLLKMLKKHEKRSGALVRSPVIQKVFDEPFYKTDGLSNLVKKCETMLGQLLSDEQSSSFASIRREDTLSSELEEKCLIEVLKEQIDIKNMENQYMKLTYTALKTLKEIRSGTVNIYSLPVIQQSGKSVEENVVVEEVAK